MKRIIFGVTDLADVLFFELQQRGIEVDAFCVNRQFKEEENHCGLQVVTYEELDTKDDIGIYICVGYHSMNQARAKIYQDLKRKKVKILSFIHESAIVMTNQIGEGCLIFENAVIGPYTKIGNANIFYPKSMVSHHSIVGDFNFFAISSSVAGRVVVKNYCFIGNNATTKDKIEIADYTLVGAGAYVKEDTKEKTCIVPAESVVLEKHASTELI